MIGLKNDFPTSTLAEWKIQLEKELKGADFSVLGRTDLIEELEYQTFHHSESGEIASETPGSFPFTRGFQPRSNEWNIGQEIVVNDAKIANEKALSLLMKGCNYLRFHFDERQPINLSETFKDIQFEYIHASFTIQSIAQFQAFETYFNHSFPISIRFSIDAQAMTSECFDYIADKAKNKQFIFCHINGFALQQTGATTWQEIAYCIAEGHERIVALLERGFTIDQATACLQFSFGIGSNYFFEIAKIRAFRSTWSKIIQAYQPIHSCSYNCEITAEIGHVNKSLKDPYTNFLRQTTEAMAACLAGVTNLIVHPYDAIAQNKTALAERMAINVSLIIKEESYFDSVIDPLGGSYAIEFITQQIENKAWNLFQEIEKLAGITSTDALEMLKSKVTAKANARIQALKENKNTLIGINKFHLTSEEDNTIIVSKTFIGLPYLQLENLLTN